MGEGALYRPILKRAWQITTKFKSLWFLGLFAAILSSGGEFELLTRIFFSPGSSDGIIQKISSNFQAGLQDSAEAGANIWSNAWSAITNSPESAISAVLVLIVGVLITLLIIWLAIVSQVGLINNINKTDKNKKTTINEGIDVGVQKLWPILVVNLGYKVLLGIVFILLGKELLLLVTLGTTGTVIHILSLIVFSIITVIISFIVRYQILNIVLNKQPVIPALKSAWQLFTKNWLISLEMAFIMFIIYLIAAYLTALLTALFFAIPLTFIAYPDQIPVIAMMTIGLISFISIFATTFFITAFVSTFNWSAWTLLYNKIQTKGPVSSIMRLSDKSPNLPTAFRRK